jgi:hypothetical protein
MMEYEIMFERKMMMLLDEFEKISSFEDCEIFMEILWEL